MKAETAGKYIGGELELFQHATHWKRYFAKYVRRSLGEHVLEVGAGIGETSPYLVSNSVSKWVCLEPDDSFCREIKERIQSQRLPAVCSVVNGTLDSLDGAALFDTILYMDVLEHIEDDAGELEKAKQYLKPGGRIVVLSPAHQFLYSPFDKAIGHFRRYSLRSLTSLCPRGMEIQNQKYLDCVGLIASLANRLLLRQSMPRLKQILFWDRVIVPVSRWIDPLTFWRLGKSVLVVFVKV
jgi:ubiquinone/menaquinone biosynthesis C-methylase UbiE